jgi:hypothetical protein
LKYEIVQKIFKGLSAFDSQEVREGSILEESRRREGRWDGEEKGGEERRDGVSILGRRLDFEEIKILW